MYSSLSSSMGDGFSLKKTKKYTVLLSNRIALRMYSDTQPRDTHISGIQKGLILIYKGTETIGEGTGFGAPILQYRNKTIFSKTSKLYIRKKNGKVTIHKKYLMDTTIQKRIRQVKLEKQKLAVATNQTIKHITKLYQKHKYLQFLSSERLLKKLGIHTDFIKTVPVGIIDVTYKIDRHQITIRADIGQIQRNDLQRVIITNEQGASFYTKYTDSNNLTLITRKIGAWQPVLANWATITDVQNKVGFQLYAQKRTTLRRGREYLRNCRNWIGLDYEINPKNVFFDYKIDILGAN